MFGHLIFRANNFSLVFCDVFKPTVIHGLCLNFNGFGLTVITGKAMSLEELIISKKFSKASLGFVSDVMLCHLADFNKLQKAGIVLLFIFLVVFSGNCSFLCFPSSI